MTKQRAVCVYECQCGECLHFRTNRIIDAPIYPRAFEVTELDYECARADFEFDRTAEERLDSSALGFALSRELSAMRELVKDGVK